MNVLLKVKPPDAAKIAHSVMAYDRVTEELDLELPIPLFLDTLALKIARVPPEDKYGALSYPLDARAVDTFRFLLGLGADLSKRANRMRHAGFVHELRSDRQIRANPAAADRFVRSDMLGPSITAS